jgi:hypothetical protein
MLINTKMQSNPRSRVTIRNIQRGFRPLLLLAMAACFSSCTTVEIYQSPIAKFQSSVNAANDGIRTYLLDINALIAEGNLYDKISSGNQEDWKLKDVNSGIPDNLIQERLEALNAIACYANALGAVANSQDVAALNQAAENFGTNVDALSASIQSAAHSQYAFQIGAPLASMVELFGTVEIEHIQRHVVERGIINGATNVEHIIQALKRDLPALAAVGAASESAIWDGKLTLYNQLRKQAAPREMEPLINQFLQDYNRVQQLRSLPINSLLDDLECANQALVSFAKSSKAPKDMTTLADQIDVFADHVKLFNHVLATIQTSINNSQK